MAGQPISGIDIPKKESKLDATTIRNEQESAKLSPAHGFSGTICSLSMTNIYDYAQVNFSFDMLTKYKIIFHVITV